MIHQDLQSIIERYCWGCEPTESQFSEITDLATELGADLEEVTAFMEEVMARSSREQMEAKRRKEAEEQAKRERMRQESEARAKKLLEEIAEKERLVEELKNKAEKDKALLEEEERKATKMRETRNRDKEERARNEKKVNSIMDKLFFAMVGLFLLYGIYAGYKMKDEELGFWGGLVLFGFVIPDIFVTIPVVWIIEKILRKIYSLEIKFGLQFWNS